MGKRGDVLPVEHGKDYANSLRCRRLDGPCEPCRLVHNTYHRERRQACGAARRKQAAYNLARTRAWARLQQKHQEEFAALMDQELRRVQPQREAAA